MVRPVLDLEGFETDTLIVLNEHKHYRKHTHWKVECKICGKIGFMRRDMILVDGRCDCSKIKPKRNYRVGKICGSYVHYLERQARKRGFDWELNSEYLWELYQKQEGKCYYSGKLMDIQYSQSNRRVGTLSLDRIDPTKGYIKENVCFVLPKINYMKKSMSEKEFLELCTLIVENKK